VHLIDSLTCSKCSGSIHILCFIDNQSGIEKKPRHLKLRNPPKRPLPHHSTTLKPDPDFPDLAATAPQFEAIN
jgi:hypothetical protein